MQLSNKIPKTPSFKKKICRFWEGFFWGMVASSMLSRWGSGIQFLVDNVEASHLYGLQVNRRDIPKAGHVAVMARAAWTSRSVGVVFFFRKVKSSAAMEAIRGSGHICWRVGTLESSKNRHGFMCVYGSKIGSMPPNFFFLNRSYFTHRHRNQ